MIVSRRPRPSQGQWKWRQSRPRPSGSGGHPVCSQRRIDGRGHCRCSNEAAANCSLRVASPFPRCKGGADTADALALAAHLHRVHAGRWDGVCATFLVVDSSLCKHGRELVHLFPTAEFHDDPAMLLPGNDLKRLAVRDLAGNRRPLPFRRVMGRHCTEAWVLIWARAARHAWHHPRGAFIAHVDGAPRRTPTSTIRWGASTRARPLRAACRP
mmetsp:Transcript_17375/g.47374  ORF Transcript_17375/g.47374 Transcript_17375/m.47374 type:complete len:213 (+) Transcript_17375:149-787(+)